MNIEGKKIVITGATSGIGFELIKNFLKYKNVDILAVGNNFNKLEPYKDKIKFFKCDVSKKESLDELFSYAINTLGDIDIFITNAGFAYYEKLNASDYQHIEKIYNVNVFAPIYSLEKLCSLPENKRRTFAVTDSLAGKWALPGYSLYSSTKFAVNGFIRAFRYEKPDNINITVVYPIATKTNFFKYAGNNEDIPIPFPMQSVESVGKQYVKAIENDTPYVYPSKLSKIALTLQRFLFLVRPIYLRNEKCKFKKWIKKNNM